MAKREWFSAAELADMALPGVPTEKKNVILMAERKDWTSAGREGIWWRPRKGRGGGVEFHYSALPAEAQMKLVYDQDVAPERPVDEAHGRREALWSWFERLPSKKRDAARERLKAVQAYDALVAHGALSVKAQRIAAGHCGVSFNTLGRWRDAVESHPRCDWLPALAPHHSGRPGLATVSEPAWQAFLADYLRLEKPTLRACWERVNRQAPAQGWTWPSETTIARRIDAMPTAAVVAAREGREALDRLYPAQRRDRSALHALEAVNLDGHRWDVFVRWPDDRIARPQMLAVQDIYSGRMLAWRIDQTLHSGLVRLAFGDVIETFGVPSVCVMDNGRENAAKDITGGVPTRYRFKVLEEDPAGLLPTMGVEVHWATPYRGQSKPIERAFRDFATEIAKHPAFAGAYTGNKPDAKPENYASAAVPLDRFVAVINEEIARHNARPGRRGESCQGRSFDETFFPSLQRSVVRRATEAQRRMFLMAAQGVRAKSADGAVELFGNRYWSEAMSAFRGQKLIVRFDPQALHAGVSVFRMDGDWVDDLPCLDKVGFFDADGAREHARAKTQWKRAQLAMLDAERRLSLKDMAAALAQHDAANPVEDCTVEPRVVRPLFNLSGGNALQARLDEEPDDEISEGDRRLLAFSRMRRGGEGFRAVREHADEAWDGDGDD